MPLCLSCQISIELIFASLKHTTPRDQSLYGIALSGMFEMLKTPGDDEVINRGAE